MTLEAWIAEPANWVFAVVAVAVLVMSVRVVSAPNVVHAALYLVGALGGSAIFFLLLSAEFVALVLVLVYVGAVLVLFLFGIMITRAPTGLDEGLSHRNKPGAALVSVVLFGVLTWGSVSAFGTETVRSMGTPTATEVLGDAILGRYVIPFEVVSFILLAALIGGVTLARRDLTPLEEEQRKSV
ncbi:MAG: NADH-quinone oxidoreductase subunit J [Acidimicrobiia bacterium]|nr:NADH-quinone oxidoreductase subunit J [Acidimicrobiia bacterium]